MDELDLARRRVVDATARLVGPALARRDLRESLEAYAARVGWPAHVLRPVWRREGLRLLHVPGYADADVVSGLCAIAPGTTVATAFVDWPDDPRFASEDAFDDRDRP